MKWEKMEEGFRIPIKSWCSEIEPEALLQAENLARHLVTSFHVALMPDCHVGYGMPIGGVIACRDSVIPNAVGVDIGCGMCAVKTSLVIGNKERKLMEEVFRGIKRRIPAGEGNAYSTPVSWEGFDEYLEQYGEKNETLSFNNPHLPAWLDEKAWFLALRNLGTLGGGNHFIELQEDTDRRLWLMLHSGSRNLGYRIAGAYHKQAMILNEEQGVELPSNELSYLAVASDAGRGYIRDMEFALTYAMENRRRMMEAVKEECTALFGGIEFQEEINIHHNYAAREVHYNEEVWVHRKGATAALKDMLGIIPGSMGTPSFIVKGLGNPLSFMSCSHGAGRKMGRMAASRTLGKKECDRAMEGIIHDPWKKIKKKNREALWDFGESPLAYKNIDEVIESENDLVEPVTRLLPIAVVKG